MTSVITIDSQKPKIDNNLHSSNTIWPDNIMEIQKLKYYHEFYPKKNEYSIINSTYKFGNVNEDNLEFNITYSDLSKITENSNLEGKISLDSLKVVELNNTFLNYAYAGKKTNLFCNLTNIENNQSFIVDTMILYSNYFRNADSNGYFQLYLNFEYLNELNYSYLMLQPINTYHFRGSYLAYENCG